MIAETFNTQVKRILQLTQLDSPNNLTLKQYFDRFKGVEDADFVKMCDWIIDNVDTRWKFPIIFDFVKAQRAVATKKTKNYTKEYRNNVSSPYGAYASEVMAGLKIQDEIRYEHCKNKINPNNGLKFGFKAKNVCGGCNDKDGNWQDGTPEIMTRLFRKAVEKGMVWEIDSKKWVQIYEGGNTWNPAEHGNW